MSDSGNPDIRMQLKLHVSGTLAANVLLAGCPSSPGKYYRNAGGYPIALTANPVVEHKPASRSARTSNSGRI
jgi:hypothetical protein